MSTWKLTLDGDTLGSLLITRVDRPWMSATFFPAPAFESWRAVFEENLDRLNDVDGASGRTDGALTASLQRFALLTETETVVEYEDLYIRGTEAWWRLR